MQLKRTGIDGVVKTHSALTFDCRHGTKWWWRSTDPACQSVSPDSFEAARTCKAPGCLSSTSAGTVAPRLTKMRKENTDHIFRAYRGMPSNLAWRGGAKDFRTIFKVRPYSGTGRALSMHSRLLQSLREGRVPAEAGHRFHSKAATVHRSLRSVDPPPVVTAAPPTPIYHRTPVDIRKRHEIGVAESVRAFSRRFSRSAGRR
jgi:hypothetical protein